MFCEIAITSGLVSKDAAKKVLAFCNKQEKEAGRRPLIGAVFTKYKILQTQDVQRIYEALQKRTGRAVGAQKAVERKPRRGKSKPRAAPPRKVDPKILWQGVGGIVVLAAVLFGMVWILTRESGSPKTVVLVDPAGAPGSLGSPDEGLEDDPQLPVSLGPKELSPEQLHEVRLKIGDARSVAGDDAIGAFKLLESLSEELESKNYLLPETLLAALLQLEEKANRQSSGVAPSQEVPEPRADVEEVAEEPSEEPEKTADEELDELLEEFGESEEE